ncbi:MAG: phage portal protein [Rhizobiales bacterium 65-9]|nr:phage portal protein [Hyphomicrobiales bacterium]OJY37863.1 MAG: phage portal protein [Rhizobiales bacterium 65-9]
MPSLLQRWFGRADQREVKDSRAGPLIAFYDQGRPRWTPRDYAALAREGYQKNAVAFRCVRLVAESVASAPMLLFDGRRELDEHPFLALMSAPNPRDGGASFLEAIASYLLVAGNAYIESVLVDGEPRELYALRPDRMRVVPGVGGWADAYDYTVEASTVRFRQDRAPVPSILHLNFFHPLDDHYGLAPMEAAASALDIHNAAGQWNKALLDNAARPSGALVYAAGDHAHLSDAQFARLKAELEENFQGAVNAGRPLLLEGGLDWKPLSLSPKDMDFIEAKAAAAREIALAFGVPPMLIGLPGDATYANYQEANRAFWRQTVTPLALRIARALLQWLKPAWPDARNLRAEIDLDQIPALSEERKALWDRVLSAGEVLSEDERRSALGYGARASAASDG